MKKARKLITFILATVMVLSMSMTAWATDITITGGAEGSVYSAYKLLNATDGGDEKFSYTLNEKYKTILEEVIEEAEQTGNNERTQEEIIDYITDQDVPAETRAFADAVYKKIKAANPAISVDATSAKVDDKVKFSGLDQGYYLIAETTKGTGADATADAYSLVMLDTAGQESIEVATKEERPTLDKKIVDDDNAIQDGSGNDIDIAENGKSNNMSVGSKVQFELIATIPENAEQYDYYYCIFGDTLSPGLTFTSEGLTVKYGDGVTFNDTLVENTGYKLHTGANADGKTFQVALLNAKSLAGKTVKVTYWAELNEEAVVGDGGNTNTATLQYSNDPYTNYNGTDDNGDGKPDDPNDPNVPIGETPSQVTTTYTTGIKILKTDGTNALKGAEFKITGNNVVVTLVSSTTFLENNEGNYYKLKDGTYTTVVPDGNNDDSYESTTVKYKKTIIFEEKGDLQIPTDVQAVVADDGTLYFNGLGEGEYTITEIQPPPGYNKIEDLTVVISWDPDAVSPNNMWSATVTSSTGNGTLTYTEEENVGILPLEVVNQAGSELPSTGGMGTTLFYIVGGALVLIAVVLLITKKRMKTEE